MQPSATLTSFAPPKRETLLTLALVFAGLAASCLCILLAGDGIVHFDDLTHYLFARWAWTWPAYLLDHWGRPGFTVLHFLPAGIGWPACRVLSAVLTAAAAWLAFRVAQRAAIPHAWAVIPFCYAQPLFFELSQTTLTETTLAFYLTAAVHLAARGRWSWSAAVLSLTLVTRHEAVIFLPLWLLVAWQSQATPLGAAGIRRTLFRLWPLVWAPIAVNVLAPLLGTEPAVFRFLHANPASQYGSGGWFTFFSRSLEAFGPGVMILAMLGAPRLWRHPVGRLVALPAVAYFAAHSILRALGLFETGGYARFLVGVSPLVGVLALAGWNRFWTGDLRAAARAAVMASLAMLLLWVAMERQLVLHREHVDQAAHLPQLHQAVRAIRVAAITLTLIAAMTLLVARVRPSLAAARHLMPAALVALIFLATYALCHPLREPREAPLIRRAIADLTSQGLGDREIITANVWVDYEAGNRLPPDRHSVRERIAAAPVGALVAWERQFAGSPDHGISLTDLAGRAGFRLVLETTALHAGGEPYLRIFEKR